MPNFTAKIKTSAGDMVFRLFQDKTPNTVQSFMHLSSKGFYDNLVFHRIIKDFMVQGGCPNGTGTGGPGYRFKDEFHKDLLHDSKGILSMANSGPNTNGSQFFITLVPTPWLDRRHTVFGELTEGEGVLDALGKTKTGSQDRPVEAVSLLKIEIYEDGNLISEEVKAPEVL